MADTSILYCSAKLTNKRFISPVSVSFCKLNVDTLKHDYTVNMNSDGQIVAASKPFHFIGKKEDIIQAGRVVKSVGDRDVLVLYHQGDFYAIDVRCYREFKTSVLNF